MKEDTSEDHIDILDEMIREHPDKGCRFWKGECLDCPYPLYNYECLFINPKEIRIKKAGEFLKKIGGLISFYSENMEK